MGCCTNGEAPGAGRLRVPTACCIVVQEGASTDAVIRGTYALALVRRGRCAIRDEGCSQFGESATETK